MGKALIIKGADFSENAVDYNKTMNYTLVNKTSIGNDFRLYVKKDRANVLVPRDEVDNPNTWGGTTGDATLQATWSMVPIPIGAKRVKCRMTNTSYYWGLNIRQSTGANLYDSGWTQGGAESVIDVDLTQYPNAVYISSTLKIGSAGTALFSNETLESVGWSIEWLFD